MEDIKESEYLNKALILLKGELLAEVEALKARVALCHTESRRSKAGGPPGLGTGGAMYKCT